MIALRKHIFSMLTTGIRPYARCHQSSHTAALATIKIALKSVQAGHRARAAPRVAARGRVAVPRYCAFWAPTPRKPFSATPFPGLKLGGETGGSPIQFSSVRPSFYTFFGQVKNLARACELVLRLRTIAARRRARAAGWSQSSVLLPACLRSSSFVEFGSGIFQRSFRQHSLQRRARVCARRKKS